jgi:hypothetical protein
MRIPIRMIGLATTFFWIFLIAFAVTAVYSLKDLQFDFGEPQTGTTADNRLFFSMPIKIFNRGFYDIGYFNVTSQIMRGDGAIVASGTTFVPVIRKGEEIATTHMVTVSIGDLLQGNQNFLFNNAELRICESMGMRVAEMIPVQVSTNFSVPWGAPLYGFALGAPEYSTYNATHLRVVVPVSFENHSFFDLAGTIQLRMLDSMSAFVGYGQTPVEARQSSSFNGFVEFYVEPPELTGSGRFEVSFLSPIFNYGPWVIPYG